MSAAANAVQQLWWENQNISWPLPLRDLGRLEYPNASPLPRRDRGSPDMPPIAYSLPVTQEHGLAGVTETMRSFCSTISSGLSLMSSRSLLKYVSLTNSCNNHTHILPPSHSAADVHCVRTQLNVWHLHTAVEWYELRSSCRVLKPLECHELLEMKGMLAAV